MTALCSRVDCGEAAVAVFGFDAAAALVWLDPFDGRAKGAGMLCAAHADTFTPLRGWTLQDRRVRAPRLWAERPRVTSSGRPGTRRPRQLSVQARSRSSVQARSRSLHPPEATDPLPFETRNVVETDDVAAFADADFERLLDPRTPLLTRAFQAARSREA
jgi:hypothetical protein